jgi:hypothetical protein
VLDGLIIFETIKLNGSPKAGVPVSARLPYPVSRDGLIFSIAPISAITNAAGLAALPVKQGLTYQVTSPALGVPIPIDTTGQAVVSVATAVMIVRGISSYSGLVLLDIILGDAGPGVENIGFTIEPARLPEVSAEKLVTADPVTVYTDSDGHASISMAKGPRYRVTSPALGDVEIIVDSKSATVAKLVGVGGRNIVGIGGRNIVIGGTTIHLSDLLP